MSNPDRAWAEHTLRRPDHTMAWYETGAGRPIVFLHGSYDHRLYRPMAAMLADAGRWVLYDQRGAGGSTLTVEDDRTLHVDRFVEDLDALRACLGLERMRLVGHSWGADLALLYAARHADRLERLALLAPGPMNDEMRRVYRANVRRMMRPEDRARWSEVNGAYRQARASGAGVPAEVDEANIRIFSPVMFYRSDAAEAFVGEYLAAGGWRRHAPSAAGFAHEACLEGAGRVECPLLVAYGYQDYEPITQGYLVRERAPEARLLFLHACGHMMWHDRPRAFAEQLGRFLAGRPVAENA